MLQQEFLKSMRYLAASVSIISAKDSNDKPYAMTASSVTSLTLEPPSILVCVNHDASIHDHLLNDEAKFCVNLLKKNQQDIATLCSIKEKEDQRFEDKNWNLDSVPFLQGSQSNLFCNVKKYLDYETHTIIIGEVYKSHNDDDFDTLMYANGKYSELIKIILIFVVMCLVCIINVSFAWRRNRTSGICNLSKKW